MFYQLLILNPELGMFSYISDDLYVILSPKVLIFVLVIKFVLVPPQCMGVQLCTTTLACLLNIDPRN